MDIIRRLPGELQNNVIFYLRYQDAICLSQVSRYFHNVIDPQAWPPAEKENFALEAEGWERYNKACSFDPCNHEQRDGYACFSCYKVLDKSGFSRKQTERKGIKDSRRYGRGRHTRFCIDCGIRRGIYKPGKTFINIMTVHFKMSSSQLMRFEDIKYLFVCGACKKAHEYQISPQPEYCRDCEDILVSCAESREDLEIYMRQERGVLAVTCQGCKGTNKVRIHRKGMSCEACDDCMCCRCFARLENCNCDNFDKASNDRNACTRLRSQQHKQVADIFERDECEESILAILGSSVND